MARQARGESICPQEIQIVHTIQRCVRQAHLCGFNHATGVDCGHRRGWVVDRMTELAGIFAIDCITFAAMSTHLHSILRSRPDIAQDWSRRDVAERWLLLFPKRRNPDGSACEPNRAELAALLRDRKKIRKIRLRLSDISWWMRCLAENIARRANKEDNAKGRFWEGRFKSQLLLRLGLTTTSWQHVIANFGRIFKRAAGREETLADEAARRGQRWMQAPGNPFAASGSVT